MKTSFVAVLIIIMALNTVRPINCDLIASMSSYRLYQTTRQCEDGPPNGFVCIGCEALAVCIKRNDRWETIPVEVCDKNNGFVCNVIEGACSNKTGPCNPINNGTFSCTSVGIFPDPYDCQLYHICLVNNNNIVSSPVECRDGSAFNPITGDCSLNINSDVCLDYGFTCTKPGDMGPWKFNPNIFYVCKADDDGSERVIYPELYKCDPNEVFVEDKCVSKDVTTTEATTEMTSDWTSETTSEQTSTITPPPSIVCTRPGVYPDPQSCLHYYYCNSQLQSERFKCPEGTFFDRLYLACLIGSC
uniref:CSON007908 protein n=1 Tax=Culicoides sonorensis TaxID=179676 RepID=A0A336MXQ5_CULSO